MSKSSVHVEKYPLPGTVDGICSLIREVLSGGHVRRLELDNDDTFVRAYRYIQSDGLEEDAPTWDGALRNVPDFQEYYSDGATSFQVVVDMLLLAQEENLHGVCWVTGLDSSPGGDYLLKTWFNVDGRRLPIGKIDALLGLPIYRTKTIPEESLILCCSKYPSAEPSEISMAIKTTIDLRRPEDDRAEQAAGRGGNHSQEHSPGAHPLALNPRGLRRISWQPPDQFGHEQAERGQPFCQSPEFGDLEGHDRDQGD